MDSNYSLLVDLYELTMAESYFRYKKNAFATFDLFVRQLPQNRSYLVNAGLNDILDYIKNLRFDKECLSYLRAQRLFSESFLKYLADFKFRGDIWAMREGEVFFANEPVIRVTASIIEAQIIESFLLNTINLQVMIASKASRVVSAAAGRGVYDFSLRRTHGKDAAIKAARSAYISGFRGTSNVLAGKLYGIPIAGTMAHSFVMSFASELESFQAYADTFPKRTILLVDTYDTKKGIANAVEVALGLKKKGYNLLGIRLDSGDMASLSRLGRKMLDASGLNYVKIFASGNLDEFKIKGLLDKGALVDNFGVGTHMGVSIDAPCLDVIYKISEISPTGKKFLPTMKLSKGKVNYPGRKQVFRMKDKQGNFAKDILALEKEKINGRPLLTKVVNNGKIIYKAPSLEEIRKYLNVSLSVFPKEMKKVYSKYKYPVEVSPALKKLTGGLRRKLIREINSGTQYLIHVDKGKTGN
jgi:nicotinate phosphoribosyltransferase